MPTEKIRICCGTCRYADLDFYNCDTDYEDSKMVDCRYPYERLPLSMRVANRERTSTMFLDADCPTWEPNT